jgi:hypothetical protein
MTRLVIAAAIAALALLGGIAYAAQMGGSNTVNACAKTEGGQLRLDRGSGCLPSEQSVALAGAPDTTVRFISGFISDGTTSSSPVLAADGRLGTLSFACGSVRYDTNPADSAAFADRINFYSPEDASSPLQVLDHLTVTWNAPGSRWFQLIIEGTVGSGDVSLTTINGFVRPFPEFSGCSYYAYVQNAGTRLPEVRTP